MLYDCSKRFFLRQRQAPSWQSNSLGTYWLFLEKSYIVRRTESGSKSKDHSVLVLETDENLVRYCRLKVLKNEKGNDFSVKWMYQATGIRPNFAINGKILVFFSTSLGVAECDWMRKSFIKRDSFFIFVVTTRLFDKTNCAITTKQHKYCSLGLQKILKSWQHAMHCRHSEQLSSFFCYVRTLTHIFFEHYRQDKRILQWYLEVIFVSL